MMIQKNDFLKWIGAIFMVFDHFAAIFFPSSLFLRIPGRISFPIFAYCAATGAIYTHDSKKYMLRLFLFALLSEPIYSLALGFHWNILFTLLCGVACITLWRSNSYVQRIFCLILLLSSFVLPFSYSWFGVCSIFLFYLTEKNLSMTWLTQGLLTVIYVAFTPPIIQAFSLCGLFVIFYPFQQSLRMPKYFFYIFYPAHLAILYFIHQVSVFLPA